jgi:Transposase IS116/IS110/IS902 family
LGLVPKQISTGDRTILGKISKRGNRYLRVLFVQAAWVVLVKPKIWERHGLKPWIEAATKRLGTAACGRSEAAADVQLFWSEGIIRPFSATQPSRWEWPFCAIWKAVPASALHDGSTSTAMVKEI